MGEKEISLLLAQIERLDDKKFDLDGWKNQTVIFLERIFGKESTKVKLIRDLHYDYSSWSLRDATGVGKAKDPVRLQALTIMEATIEEIQKLGLPGIKAEASRLNDLLHDELTGKQMKEIETILVSEDNTRIQKITKIIDSLEKEKLAAILAQLLVS